MPQTSDVILERMMALHPKIIDLTLDRMWRLLDALGNPQDRIPPVIHIAGTNGKGSTQAMIRAGLEAAGKRVHAYTSPHLARFHERIRLAGDLITEEALTACLDECYVANGGENITYFEITTAAALLAFSRIPADYTLLEVGLGGRLDATNVIPRPALTIITPVDLDHQQFLGDTLGEIAGEKAGILKPGVTGIIARQQPEGRTVIEERGAAIGAPLLIQGQDFDGYEERGGLTYHDEQGLIMVPRPALPGPHQIGNAACALAALRHLLPREGREAAEAGAMTDVVWPARMQHLTQGRLVDLAAPAELWLDGGHNPAAGVMLTKTLAELPLKPVHLICGMLSTKDVRGYLRPLAGVAQSLTAVSIPGETATLSAEQTAQAARDTGHTVHVGDSVDNSILSIVQADPEARILICGSLYLAGNVLRENEIA